MGDIRDLLPRDKCDLDRADEVIAQGYPAVAPILPELMTWLQDGNWPVCKIIAPFLAGLGTVTVPEIRRVLETRDEQWKYGVLQYLVRESAEVEEAVRDQLTRIAETEPTNEDEAETHLLAKEILGRMR